MKVPHPLDLMRVQARALYVLDGQDRLRLTAEAGWPADDLDPAPRFFMGRTTAGNLWHVRHDLPPDLVTQMDTLCQREAPWSAQPLPPAILPDVQALLGPAESWRGPAYFLPPSQRRRSSAVPITLDNAHLLERHFPALYRRVCAQGKVGPVVASVAGEHAVSVCSCVRLSAQAAEAGVETTETHRGQGHALQAVGLWAERLHQQGLWPLYSTAWENAASQAVARKLGAVLYGEDWSVP